MLLYYAIVCATITQVICNKELTPEEYLDEARIKYESARKRFARFILPPVHQNSYEEIQQDESFDFIIVGSGSSGAVLANRLSENPNWRILLLEVGREPPILHDIPVLAPLFQFTDLNWNYLAERETNHSLGLIDERMPWPRGRGLGGTSLINYMISVRGNRRDYNRWAKMGNPGWSYRDLFRYFTKSEDAVLEYQDEGYHGVGGYLSVRDVPFRTEATHAFVKAAQEAGHRYVDYNGKAQMGVSYVQSNTKRGKRWSVERAFIETARNRDNLKILTNARAVQILIDDNRQAYGVKYIKDRKYQRALAKREVILSAGAFNSPQLLMLSGIGPKAHLKELGIDLIQDLPVGQKLYDHITFLGLVFTVNQSIVNQQSVIEDPNSFIELIANGRGPLSGLGGVEALAYLKTNASRESKDYPDMELIFISGGLHTDRGLYYRKTFRLKDEIYDTVWKPLEDKFAFQILPMLVHPKSYGKLQLKSRNPYHWPKLYGGFFSDPRNDDIKTFVAAIREVQAIIKMPSLQKYGVEQVKTKIPGCEHLIFDSDDYWECALRHITPTLHHQVATCKMGPSHDPEAVVDNKLRVYGVKNLRVADTSIIPIPLTAHTNVPAIMVGEKASDLIKEDWKGDDNLRRIDIRSNYNV